MRRCRQIVRPLVLSISAEGNKGALYSVHLSCGGCVTESSGRLPAEMADCDSPEPSDSIDCCLQHYDDEWSSSCVSAYEEPPPQTLFVHLSSTKRSIEYTRQRLHRKRPAYISVAGDTPALYAVCYRPTTCCGIQPQGVL